jgi:hypothetical protein
LEHQFDAFLWERQTYAVDSDCTVVKTYCPFGYGVGVAKAHAAEVSSEHDRLHAEYAKDSSCKYRCRVVVSTSCKNGRCTPHP